MGILNPFEQFKYSTRLLMQNLWERKPRALKNAKHRFEIDLEKKGKNAILYSVIKIKTPI